MGEQKPCTVSLVSMTDNFRDDINQFFYSRVERINSPEEVSPERKVKAEEYTELAEHLRQILPDSAKQTLMKLDDVWTCLETLSIDAAYRRGFSDGVRFIIQMTTGGSL